MSGARVPDDPYGPHWDACRRDAYRDGAEAMRTAVLNRIGDRFRSLSAEVVMIQLPKPKERADEPAA